MVGLQGLLESRRFWTVLITTVSSIALLLATRYLSPADVEMVKQIVAQLQTLAFALIGFYTIEGWANIQADKEIQVTELNNAQTAR